MISQAGVGDIVVYQWRYKRIGMGCEEEELEGAGKVKSVIIE